MKKIELSNIQSGVVFDLFDEEFRKVLANIEDENTIANSERSITLKIAIKPYKTRRTGEVRAQAYAAFAKVKPVESLVFFDREENGRLAANEDDPGPELPGIADDSKVKQFKNASNEG